MITINLLQATTTKKKASRKLTELQQQMILGGLVLALVFIGMSFYYGILKTKIDHLAREKTAAEAKIREQDNMLKEVKTIEDERKKVLEKIAIIDELKKKQTLLVHLLDEVSKALPKGVNLTMLSEKSGQINIEGTAFTNNDIVRFIDNLKTCPSMSDVFLQETVQAKQDEIEIYKYKLQFLFKGV
jgi:type IV pilus assembly protein PilN